MSRGHKPTPTEVARAGRLTLPRDNPARPDDPITACNLCGLSSEALTVHRECDQWDRPLDGPTHLLFVDVAHRRCMKVLEQHPRLYREETGLPGTFPQLCGPCVHRDGFGCKHPDLKANGGPGLNVSLDGLNAIVCTRGKGCSVPVKRAVKCAGREVR